MDAMNIFSKENFGLEPGLPPDFANKIDFTTQRGALKLARSLEDFWKSKGYPFARFVVKNEGQALFSDGRATFGVRSNLVNGVPPETIQEAHARRGLLQ